jgi:2-keto-3-deoxy-L-rhamnonate aldolase RhmA
VAVAVMIEKASGVEHLEAMLSVKSVDMVQFGPADYSLSIDWFKGNGAKLRAMMGA